MTILIENPDLKEIQKLLNSKKKKSRNKGNLLKHFGKLKRNINGMEYQTKIRLNED